MRRVKIYLAAFLLILPATAAAQQLPRLSSIPDTLPETVRQALSQDMESLKQAVIGLSARVNQHNSECRSTIAGTARDAECREMNGRLMGEARSLAAKMKDFNQAVDEAKIWGTGSKPPADITEAVKKAINAAVWPPRVKLILSKTKFIWKAERASALEFFNPTLNLPAAYDPAAGALVIKPGFTKRTLATQIDLLSFEMGKMIWDRRSVAYQRRFSEEFAGTIAAQGLDRLPNSRDVIEKDDNATFSFAYRHFLFDRQKLPRDLVKWWSNDPPHAVLEVRGGDAIRPIQH